MLRYIKYVKKGYEQNLKTFYFTLYMLYYMKCVYTHKLIFFYFNVMNYYTYNFELI